MALTTTTILKITVYPSALTKTTQINQLYNIYLTSPLTTFLQTISLNQKTPINGSLPIGIAKAHTS